MHDLGLHPPLPREADVTAVVDASDRDVGAGGFEVPPLERTPRNRRLWEQTRALGAELGLELEDTHLENMEKWFKIVTDLRGQEAIDEFDRL